MVSNLKNQLPGYRASDPALNSVEPSEKMEQTALFLADTSSFRVASGNSEVRSRADRLREVVRMAGGNRAVSKRSGVPLSTLGVYLAGGEWKVTAAIALARACGVSVEWLTTGSEYRPPGETETVTLTDGNGNVVVAGVRRITAPVASPPMDDQDAHAGSALAFIPIPRYDVKASAGLGNSVIGEEFVGYLALEEGFLKRSINRNTESLVSIEADGDSMDPTIRDGDILIVDTSVTEVENSKIYIIDIGGRLLVKRIQLRLDGSLVVKSDNPKYDPEIIHPSERSPIRIVGQVVYQAGPVRA